MREVRVYDGDFPTWEQMLAGGPGASRLARMRDVPVRKRTASNELRSRGRGRVVRIGIPLRGPEVRFEEVPRDRLEPSSG